jgi:Glutaminase/Protein of unknown function (DUF3011)
MVDSACLFGLTSSISASQDNVNAAAQSPAQMPTPPPLVCASKAATRQTCPADTSKGVVLQRSFGGAACLLGKTWGYDDRGVWVSDGCVGEFLVWPSNTEVETPNPQGALRYVPNAGFLIVEDEKGEMYVRLFSYARYLNLLYDDSGKWLYRTGLPAKSGVGGGLIAVSPGRFGIAVVAPPLDDAGNSVKAQKAIADISNALGGNPYAAKPKS